jgi:hypothetical protein
MPKQKEILLSLQRTLLVWFFTKMEGFVEDGEKEDSMNA